MWKKKKVLAPIVIFSPFWGDIGMVLKCKVDKIKIRKRIHLEYREEL